jgi:uncharacterized damage-inducible protein DinB
MKDYVILLTKYNRQANGEVTRLIESLSVEARTADRKSFAGSLHGLLSHIASGAVVFQKLIKPHYPELTCLEHKFVDFKLEQGKLNFPDFAELKEALTILDNAYVSIATSSPEANLTKELTITTPYGPMKQTLTLTLLRYVNHSTHHRGQISQILDAMGVPNDYSRLAEAYD